jgi:membrane protein YqaA with SNARE-associated domain
MKRVVDGVQAFALGLGAPGLFVVAFLDSSFLSLPEINDLLLVMMVTREKSRMVLYAGSATLGSIAGCLILYYIGRTGGDALVRRRFSSDRVDRALRLVRRYGVMSLLIPSLLPPPAPFKIFVLLSGVAGIGVSRFVVAIAIGRGLRYFGEGLLAVRYGDQAVAYIDENGGRVALGLVAVLLAGTIGYILWRKARGEKDRYTADTSAET